jgi:hypothetical protein
MALGENGFLYVRDGDHYVPTLLTTGPWRADAMHGGAPSALIGTLISPVVEEGELVAGVQIDLERPVPLEPLLGSVRRRQVSRRIAHLEVELSTDSSRAVSAKALVIRKESVSVAGREESLPEHPGRLASMDWSPLYADVTPIFVRDAVDHRVVRGGYGVPMPSAAWLRLKVPVIAGQESCGLSQLLAVADCGESDECTRSRLRSDQRGHQSDRLPPARRSLVLPRRDRARRRGRCRSGRDLGL